VSYLGLRNSSWFFSHREGTLLCCLGASDSKIVIWRAASSDLETGWLWPGISALCSILSEESLLSAGVSEPIYSKSPEFLSVVLDRSLAEAVWFSRLNSVLVRGDAFYIWSLCYKIINCNLAYCSRIISKPNPKPSKSQLVRARELLESKHRYERSTLLKVR